MAAAVVTFYSNTKIRGSVGPWFTSLKVLGIITATLTKQGSTVEQTATQIGSPHCSPRTWPKGVLPRGWVRCQQMQRRFGNPIHCHIAYPFSEWTPVRKMCVVQNTCQLVFCCAVLSCVQLFVTPWTLTSLPCPWGFPGKNTGVGHQFLLQGEWQPIFPGESTGAGCHSRSRNWTSVSCISCLGRRIPYHWATWKAHLSASAAGKS